MTEQVSRSEVKRRFKQTEEVAAQLAELTDNDLKRLPCNEEVKGEIRAIRTLKGGARKRQVKYLAKLLRQDEMAEVYDFLEDRKGSGLKEKKTLHEAERLRDVIINEAIDSHERCRREQEVWEMDWPSREIDAACARFPELSEGEVRKITYSYVKTRNRAHYRELFRMIKAAIDQEELKARLA
jgi:ribosome-associated protein